MSVERLPVVGVLGSGSAEHRERAQALGRWLAGLGVHLLTGGGGGVMNTVSHAFSAVPGRRGRVIGILPSAPGGAASVARQGYPNPWVEIAVFTHLHLSGGRGTEAMSRNHINVLSSDVLVALPGGSGTASEISLALRYGRPVIAFLRDREEIPDLPEAVPAVDELMKVQEFVREKLGIEHRERNRGRHHRGPIE